MARKNASRGHAKHAKAVKRRKKLARRTTKASPSPVTSPARVAPPTRSHPPHRPRVPAPAELWDVPSALALPEQLRRIETFDWQGPSILAMPIEHGRRVVLYLRGPDDTALPTRLCRLPIDQEVAWLSDPPAIREAKSHHVAWAGPPALRGDALVGTLVVYALVSTEEGAVWAPRIPVRIGGGTDEPDVDAGGIAGGALHRDSIDWEWGCYDTHVAAVTGFLDQQVPVLWRVLDGEMLGDGWWVDAIRGPSPVYKFWAVDDLVAHADEAVPQLLALLDEVLDGAVVDPMDHGPLYALSVLAHLGGREAHERLLALARLDRDRFEHLFGTYLTDGFAAALLRTCGGDLTGVRELVADPSLDGYVRGQAVEALAGAVALGHLDQSEVVAHLASLLRPDAAVDPDSYVWTAVVSAMIDLHAVDHQDAMLDFCAAGFVDPMVLDEHSVREGLASEPADLDELRCLELTRGDDVHEWIGWWAF